MPKVNFIQIAKDVEKFYLSGNQKASINVIFNSPINDKIVMQVIRKSTYTDTLSAIITSIKLFLSNCQQISYNGTKHIAYSIESRKHILSQIYANHFQKHLIANGLNGQFIASI